MKKKFTKILSLALATIMLASCGGNTGSSSSSNNSGGTVSEHKYPEFITIDLFSQQANYQGIQSGWFAEIVKEKFNMEINIIAPNVAGGGDTLYQTRTTAGDLGDLVFIGTDNGRLQDLVTAGLVIDMTPYLENAEYVTQYDYAIGVHNSILDREGIYAVPSSVSEESPVTSSDSNDLTFGPYVRWDLYKELGYPELNTLEDLLPVLKDMQELEPTTEDGKKVYGFSLFKDWDGNMMMMGKQPATLYGYDEIGFAFEKADGSGIQSILDSDSGYIRSLRFYFEANQMGLMDPESSTQNYDMVWNKYVNGEILYSPWPWLGQLAYNTTEHKNEGKGFMLAPVKDMEIYSYGFRPAGDKYMAAIGTKAEDPQRIADFIDWMYSPEGASILANQMVEGIMWNNDNGRPEMTEFGISTRIDGSTDPMPAELGGGAWKDGESQIGFLPIASLTTNPETGEPYIYTAWESIVEMNNTVLDNDWKEFMGATTTKEYLQNNDMMSIAPGSDFIHPVESLDIQTLRNQIKEVIKEHSWRMVFASDEAEFERLLKSMQDTAYGLGYEEVLEFDMQAAEDLHAARAKVIVDFEAQN